VADALAVLDASAIDDAWIVGHSWGGHLALHLACAYPERVTGLVLIDSLGALRDGGMAELGTNVMAQMTADEQARYEEIDRREEEGTATEEESLEGVRVL